MAVLLTPFDLKRLDSYANNLLDYHVILDLLPIVAALYFEKRLGPEVHLSAVQSSILLALGLQRKTVEEIEVSHFYITRTVDYYPYIFDYRTNYSCRSHKPLLYL